MKDIKRFIVALAAFVACSSYVFAGPNSSVFVSNYNDGDSFYIYETFDINQVRREIKGTVSSDCVSVRCIWSSQSQDYINDYLLNGSATSALMIDDFTLTKYVAGSREFTYNIGGALDNMRWGSNYYRFIAKFSDGTYRSYSMTLYIYTGGGSEKGKPVIYLYPTKTRTVEVSVAPVYGLTVTIPEMGKKWKVTATPDGVITDQKSKEVFPYLFWESHDSPDPIDLTQGFVVPEEELESFFDEKLAYLGLVENEISDFKEFWIPILEGKPYVFVTFYSKDRIDAEAPLTVSPKPDSVIRVFFDYQKLDEPIETVEQILQPAQRSGFAVVEWGGRLYR